MFTAQRSFHLRSTLLANVLLQVLALLVIYFILDHQLLLLLALIASVVYWLLVASFVMSRREHMKGVEKIALLYGYGFCLPVAAVLLYLWRMYI